MFHNPTLKSSGLILSLCDFIHPGKHLLVSPPTPHSPVSEESILVYNSRGSCFQFEINIYTCSAQFSIKKQVIRE